MGPKTLSLYLEQSGHSVIVLWVRRGRASTVGRYHPKSLSLEAFHTQHSRPTPCVQSQSWRPCSAYTYTSRSCLLRPRKGVTWLSTRTLVTPDIY